MALQETMLCIGQRKKPELKHKNIKKNENLTPYKRRKITDDLHEAFGFRTDYQFITKSKMKTIQKKSKRKE